MNKLILIGNGFDKAHGLPTSYSDFINDFWKNIHLNYKKDEYKKVVLINEEYYRLLNYEKPAGNYEDFRSNLKVYSDNYNYRYDEKNHFCRKDNHTYVVIFKFENDFLKQISINNSIQNWVDIENEYYKELKKIVKSEKLSITQTEERWLREKKIKVEKLNEEFNQVKELLKKYLIEKVNNTYKMEVRGRDWFKFFNIMRPISNRDDLSQLQKEFSNETDKEIVNLIVNEEANKNISDTYLLSFNYTSLLHWYLYNMEADDLQIKLNHIHGQLGDPAGDIIFGFGDEMDDDYKLIENIDDNEYLKYFKSFQYFQTSNYKNLLSFINGCKFQLYIAGHSCGLSDRVLLNTIFEHKNCCSIKVFFHDSMGKDNYTEIIQNISRHFNDKELMRQKIVEKVLCKPLPQIQLQLK